MAKSISASPEFSVREFFSRFPDDDACLAHVMEQRYGLKGFCPSCGVEPGNEGRVLGGKTIVLGMKQRGGRIVTEVIPDVKMSTIKPMVLETIEEGAKISTDELLSYGLLTKHGYDHGSVKHKAKEWA